ncbi:MAG: DNA/RNA non-specific endonuclease [Oscillospiraceae bacterium]|nr:DNA/RNA non-specific endonuclease [Oscillospiraceae bacterium]
MKRWIALLLALIMAFTFTGCEEEEVVQALDIAITVMEALSEETTPDSGSGPSADTPEDTESIPPFSGEAYIAINGNIPFFVEEEYTTESYEFYSELDDLGRCGVTMACIGLDIMPTDDRGDIGSVKPSGWHSVKYDCVDGKYLYNRCHLIGFQLAGENANKRNLITGTRYLNIEGMLPFENLVADYVKETGNHVLYRVTPIFEGDNLVATGVCMEGWSVEDNGEGVCFCVFAYNAQPGIVIDYATGESWEE